VGYDFSRYEYATFDSHTLYNARLTVKPVQDLSVYLDVRNITDEYYGYKPEFPMPGRTVAVGLRYEF
jgi:vitamin B12 transporter